MGRATKPTSGEATGFKQSHSHVRFESAQNRIIWLLTYKIIKILWPLSHSLAAMFSMVEIPLIKKNLVGYIRLQGRSQLVNVGGPNSKFGGGGPIA